MRAHITLTLVCAITAISFGCDGGGQESGSIALGNRAPEFSLKSLEGTTVTSSSLEGEVVVLNFWATWCGPCLSEIPELKEVAASSKARVVGIALDEQGLKAVKPFVDRYGLNYTVLLGDQALFQRFHGFGIPYTLVLDRSQRVVRIYRGPTTKKLLEQDLMAIG